MENHKMTLMGAFVAIGLVMAWFLGVFDGVDPAVLEAQEYRDAKIKEVMDLPQEQRRSVFEGLRERVEKLSDSQREQFFESSRPMFQQMMVNRAKQLQEMSQEERNKALDEFIDRMEERRSQAGSSRQQERRQEWESMSDAERDQRRKEMLDRTTPQMRAAMDIMKDMMNARREQRGLEPINGPPFGRPPRQ